MVKLSSQSKSCVVCGVVFLRRSNSQITCSPECRAQRIAANNGRWKRTNRAYNTRMERERRRRDPIRARAYGKLYYDRTRQHRHEWERLRRRRRRDIMNARKRELYQRHRAVFLEQCKRYRMRKILANIADPIEREIRATNYEMRSWQMKHPGAFSWDVSKPAVRKAMYGR